MSGFLSIGDLSFLHGMHLAQIQVSKYIVSFNFHEECQISTEGIFDHFHTDGISTYEVYGTKEFRAWSLLEEQISAVQVLSDTILEISFTHGESLRIRAGNRGSSCTISIRGRTIVAD